MDPGSLLKRAANGDADAFRQLCTDVLGELRQSIARRCRELRIPADLVGDFTHDTLIKALDWLSKNPEATVHWGWLQRVSQNLLYDWVKTKHSTRFVRDELLDSMESQVTSAPVDLANILNVYEKLSLADREIIDIVLFEGARMPEAARRLDLSLWAAYKRYERALARLRQLCDVNSKQPTGVPSRSRDSPE